MYLCYTICVARNFKRQIQSFANEKSPVSLFIIFTSLLLFSCSSESQPSSQAPSHSSSFAETTLPAEPSDPINVTSARHSEAASAPDPLLPLDFEGTIHFNYKVACCGQNNNQIYYSLTGGNDHTTWLTRGSRSAQDGVVNWEKIEFTWSPDMESHLYQECGYCDGEGLLLAQVKSSVFIISDASLNMDPSWSPDGNHFSYFRYDPSGNATNVELALVNAEPILIKEPFRHWRQPEETKAITIFPNYERISSATWSPDGKHLLFSAAQEIFTIDIETELITQITFCSDFTSGCFEPSNSIHAKWSPNGNQIIFSNCSELSDICTFLIMDTDGTNKQLLGEFSNPSGKFALSNDGSQIAFAGNKLSTNANGPNPYLHETSIFLLSTDPSGRNKPFALTSSNHDGNPVWSPDDSQIVFSRETFYRPQRSEQLFIINADGTNLTATGLAGIPLNWLE